VNYARIGAAFLALVVLAALVVACQAEVNRWSQAPPIVVDVDAPKAKRPTVKVPAPKAPAYRAPATGGRR
jgi:hypothetical protein